MPLALVTGASQGVGRGILEGLCEAGYRVFFTGRDAERLVRTSEEAGKLGGEPMARVVDHRDDQAVDTLFDEIAQESEPLSILANCCWAGYENMMEGDRFAWVDPFWQLSRTRWDEMFTSGVRAGFIAAQRAVPLMLDAPSALIVNLSSFAAQKHIANTLYGMAKATTDKMTSDMAHELRDTPINVVSLYPGLVSTERVEAANAFDLSTAESPRFSGRVVAALAERREAARRLSGSVCIGAALAREFNVVDIDGSSPPILDLASV